MTQALTETERWPLLTENARRMLHRLYQHPHAPKYNHRCGDRLRREGLRRVGKYARELESARIGWKPGEIPAWVRRFAKRCLEKVPVYRARGGSADDFLALPTVTRAELGREPWAFVPDDQPLDDLILYATSGRTGHPIEILSHPEVSSKYIPLLQRALAPHKVRLRGGAGRVSIITVCAQKSTYTYASVSMFLNGAGFAKINLNPSEWTSPKDRVTFLDGCNPEIYTGDPIAFLELAKLKLRSRPRALVSTAMTLLPKFRRQLEKRFCCPVIDLYSLNETGPVAVGVEGGHRVFVPDVFVEVLRADGTPCDEDEHGEITLTTARNPFLALLRYRTGDWGRLTIGRGVPILKDLEGRPPVLFRHADGSVINNIDVTNALRGLPLAQFQLRQRADGSVLLRVRADRTIHSRARRALRMLFGAARRIEVRPLSDRETRNGKLIQYTSEMR